MLTEVLPVEERAIEAVVARYQRVAPAVTRFARTMAENDELQVRLGSQASAGADEVVIDPGVFQAAYARSAPVTPTEVALASALHEVVHLVATDFDEKRPIPEGWLPAPEPDTGAADENEVFAVPGPFDADFLDEPQPDPEDDAIAPLDDATDDVPSLDQPVSLLDALGRAGGPAAEALFLALEDARQELQYFSTYAGARSVLQDIYLAAVPDAVERSGALGQYALSCFLLVGGYVERGKLERTMAAPVVAALNDAIDFLDAAADSDDPWEVGGLALQLLQVAKMHGLITEGGASDTIRQTKERQGAESDAISDSVDAVRMVSPVLRDQESYEDTRQASQSVSAEAGKKGSAEQAGDPATDQIVKISESPTVYLPTGQGGKLMLGGFPDIFRKFSADGRQALDEAARRWGVAQRRVSGELYPLFLANQRRGLRSGFDAGDLSPYTALLLGGGLYERMFERRDLPSRRSYAVSLLVDGSASMLQPRELGAGAKKPWALAAATLGAWTLAHLADELQIEFEVAIFNRAFAAAGDDSEASFVDRRHRTLGALRRSQGGSADRLTRTVNHYLIKSFDQRWRTVEDVLAGLFWMASAPREAALRCRKDPEETPPVSMFDKAANVDEFNVSYAAERLTDRRAGTRILVVLSDGMTRGSIQALADSVEAVEHGGTVVLGIGIGSGTVETTYERHEVVYRPDTLAAAMIDGVRGSLHRTLASMGGNTWWAHSSEQALYDSSPRRSA